MNDVLSRCKISALMHHMMTEAHNLKPGRSPTPDFQINAIRVQLKVFSKSTETRS